MAKVNLSDMTHEQATKWAKQQLANGVSRRELRALADQEDRKQHGSWGAVDALRKA